MADEEEEKPKTKAKPKPKRRPTQAPELDKREADKVAKRQAAAKKLEDAAFKRRQARTSKKLKKPEPPWPQELWRIAVGTKLVMAGTNAVVSAVDRQGRPTKVSTRDDDGKVVDIDFELEDYVRLK